MGILIFVGMTNTAQGHPCGNAKFFMSIYRQINFDWTCTCHVQLWPIPLVFLSPMINKDMSLDVAKRST